MSTEINFIDPIGGLFRLIKGTAKVVDLVEKTNAAAKEREKVRKQKTELLEMGVSVNSVRSAWMQGKITYDEYQDYKTILES